jgi:hypothetical protein
MRPRWILPVVLVAVIITAAAGLVARAVYARPVEKASAAVVVPNGNPVPPTEQPGDATVTATTDAAAHPLYEPIRAMLQTYFDSINNRHYDQWRTVVSALRASTKPRKDWLVDFRSTKDGSIVVYRVESGPTGTARVLLSFTSLQEPIDAPPELPEHCIRWRVIWPIVFEAGEWKLGLGTTGSGPQHEKC